MRVYLHRRDAQIEQYRVDAGDLATREQLIEVAEVAAQKREFGTIARRYRFQLRGGLGERHLVLVDADEQAA